MFACDSAEMIQIRVHQVCIPFVFEIPSVKTVMSSGLLATKQKAVHDAAFVITCCFPYELQESFLNNP